LANPPYAEPGTFPFRAPPWAGSGRSTSRPNPRIPGFSGGLKQEPRRRVPGATLAGWSERRFVRVGHVPPGVVQVDRRWAAEVPAMVGRRAARPSVRDALDLPTASEAYCRGLAAP
jgi:hypothetical protein